MSVPSLMMWIEAKAWRRCGRWPTPRRLSPEEIRLVVMHLQADHASAEFPGATIRVASASGRTSAAPSNGYSARQLEADIEYRLLDLDGEGTPYERFERSLDLYGDGSLRVLPPRALAGPSLADPRAGRAKSASHG